MQRQRPNRLQRQRLNPARLQCESGAVTAELAIVLPAALAVVAVILAVGQQQLQQQRLVVSAATLARAMARGEAPDLVDEWVARLSAQKEVSYEANLVCVKLTQPMAALAFAKLESLVITEVQCAEKQ